MINNPRRMWTSIIFIVLFAPFVVLLVLSFMMPNPRTGGTLGMAQSGVTEGGGATAGGGGGGAALATGGTRADSPLLAAGDGHELWVARPRLDEKKTPGFELLLRSANTGIWRIATNNGTQTFCTRLGLPQGIALGLPHGGGAGSSPYVFGQAGNVYQFSLNGFDVPQELLPASELLKATAGGQEQLFAVTFGQPRPELRPGDKVPSSRPAAGSAPASAPASTTASTTATASATATATATTTAASQTVPSTTQSGPPPDTFNVYWNLLVSRAASGPASAPENPSRPATGVWSFLPPLGKTSGDAARVPTPSSMIALVESRGRLLVLWVDPVLRPRKLMARTLDYATRDAQWSDPIETTLPENEAIPAGQRLFTINLDGTLYVLWTVPTGQSIAIHGGWMNTHAAGAEEWKLNHLILPMSLGVPGQGLEARDVAVGASENSIITVALMRDGTLKSAVFDNQGHEISPLANAEIQSTRREVQIGQNIAMILVVLMLALSFWQWRQKAPPVVLPKGMVVAPMHLRGGAFFIDFAVPYIIVLILFAGWDGGPFTMVSEWLSLPSHPEDFPHAWSLFIFLGIYLLHVVIGEMFFRRSLGKWLLGLEVRMLDGRPPTVAAVLIRNLVRVPECAVGIVLLYMVVSDRRQRLGDLLAKTVVLGQQSPEIPEDPDKKS